MLRENTESCRPIYASCRSFNNRKPTFLLCSLKQTLLFYFWIFFYLAYLFYLFYFELSSIVSASETSVSKCANDFSSVLESGVQCSSSNVRFTLAPTVTCESFPTVSKCQINTFTACYKNETKTKCSIFLGLRGQLLFQPNRLKILGSWLLGLIDINTGVYFFQCLLEHFNIIM